MKGLFIAFAVVLSSFSAVDTAQAGDCDKECRCRPVATVVKMVRPVDVIKSVGCWGKKATCKTLNGVGTVLKGTVDGAETAIKGTVKGTHKILTAPFKTGVQFPKMRTYRWFRGHWHEVEEVQPPLIEMGTPVESTDTQFIPAPMIDPDIRDTIVFFEGKF